MNMTLSRRCIVRLISFGLALLLVLAVLAGTSARRARIAEQQLEYQYLRSIDDLGNYLENIETALTKTMYAGTAPTMTNLTSKLWRESGFAKESLSVLPMNELNLESTYKFLSQLGDYAVSLSKKMERGETITEEERQNLSKMKAYADQFLQEVLVLQDNIRTGTVSLSEVKQDVSGALAVNAQESLSEGFLEFEEGFTAYPTLIYDGPFSDHILQKKPEMLMDAPEVSQEEAQKTAAAALEVDATRLQPDTDEEGNMPSYCFQTDTSSVAVTKQGGLVSYCIRNREVSEQKMTVSDCLGAAEEYLRQIGIEGVTSTYYEIADNRLTVNFAHTEQDVMCYTDLVKVTVAMDNADILSYDGRGYLTNHHDRGSLTPSISQEQAQQAISPLLTVKSAQLALIPDEGLNKVLCYEFKCSSAEDENVLVYVNAETGAEQQILVLYIDENGTLTL